MNTLDNKYLLLSAIKYLNTTLLLTALMCYPTDTVALQPQRGGLLKRTQQWAQCKKHDWNKWQMQRADAAQDKQLEEIVQKALSNIKNTRDFAAASFYLKKIKLSEEPTALADKTQLEASIQYDRLTTISFTSDVAMNQFKTMFASITQLINDIKASDVLNAQKDYKRIINNVLSAEQQIQPFAQLADEGLPNKNGTRTLISTGSIGSISPFIASIIQENTILKNKILTVLNRFNKFSNFLQKIHNKRTEGLPGGPL